MTKREKYEVVAGINALDQADKKVAVMYADILNWVKVFRAKELRNVLKETRGRLQNSKGYVVLNSTAELQNEVLSAKYKKWPDDDVAINLIKKFYKKKFKLEGSVELTKEEELDIEECLEHVQNMINNGGFDLELWYNVCYSN
ncbi:MAG: hypothetical protein ACRCZE_00345 [Candidatus Altimarinota bacterium]